MPELNRCNIFHEIGHTIVGLIFSGYLMKVERIILNKDDIKKLNLSPNDLAYTHQKPVIIDQAVLDENIYLYAMINGLNFLGGIAGATFLCPEDKPELIEVDESNFNDILVIEGSSGDFEYINGKRIFYSWFLFTQNQFTQESAYMVHAVLMNILQDIFLDDRIRKVALNIYNHIIENPGLNVELEKLSELFPEDLQKEFKDDLIQKFLITE